MYVGYIYKKDREVTSGERFPCEFRWWITAFIFIHLANKIHDFYFRHSSFKNNRCAVVKE